MIVTNSFSNIPESTALPFASAFYFFPEQKIVA